MQRLQQVFGFGRVCPALSYAVDEPSLLRYEAMAEC
jgi:hypothetical protein